MQRSFLSGRYSSAGPLTDKLGDKSVHFDKTSISDWQKLVADILFVDRVGLIGRSFVRTKLWLSFKVYLDSL